MKMKTMTMGETWAGLGSIVAGAMFASAMFQQYFPQQLRDYIRGYVRRLMHYLHPYMQITFPEYSGGRFSRNEAYIAIEAFLGTSSSKQAKRLKADIGKNSKNLVLNLDDQEEVTDEFQGVKLWWASHCHTKNMPHPYFGGGSEEKRSYRLTFHKRHRELITTTYLSHVLEEGKAIGVRNRERKLYTNDAGKDNGWSRRSWNHVVFEHRASFRTLAMDPEKKKDIVDDLMTFSNSKDYYEKIGKAWKRGYLLYGPPGTGKTSMIAAMANLLSYDIYDLELTAVKSNTELRKLLIETSGKSIIVIEDIDCSLDLAGQRKKEKEKEEEEEKDKKDPSKKAEKQSKSQKSEVTLSGLLNFIDGLWSSCGEERIIVFTTNHVEKLDQALTRSGRMDKHIELSYCSFEGFKVLAKTYLDLEAHPLFETIHLLMGETQITPADVAENLMPKTIKGDAGTCLENLIRALEKAKEKAGAEVEAKLGAEKEAKEKESSDKQEAVKKYRSLISWYRSLFLKKENKRSHSPKIEHGMSRPSPK